MSYREESALAKDSHELAEVRVQAMKESLVAIGRYDPERSKERFFSSFDPIETTKILIDGKLIAFYSYEMLDDHIFLKHLYILPSYQNQGIGARVVSRLKEMAQERKIRIRLGALRESRSNQFYLAHGFIKTHEKEWDIHYEYVPS